MSFKFLYKRLLYVEVGSINDLVNSQEWRLYPPPEHPSPPLQPNPTPTIIPSQYPTAPTPLVTTPPPAILHVTS